MEKVYLGIPTYDEWVHTNCMMGVIHASKRYHLQMNVIGSSALPFAFNQLWAGAATSGCDYFAMCHADIGPDAHWIDTLIDELEKHQADIMSATVPIKDHNKVYSVALCHLGQPAHYRLTVPHFQALPETYGNDDIQRVTGEEGLLCANTGLWVCRLDADWIQKVHFEFITSIDWSGEKPRCHFIPEDWQLSQMLHTLGKKVMCTKKVRVLHAGNHVWASR